MGHHPTMYLGIARATKYARGRIPASGLVACHCSWMIAYPLFCIQTSVPRGSGREFQHPVDTNQSGKAKRWHQPTKRRPYQNNFCNFFSFTSAVLPLMIYVLDKREMRQQTADLLRSRFPEAFPVFPVVLGCPF